MVSGGVLVEGREIRLGALTFVADDSAWLQEAPLDVDALPGGDALSRVRPWRPPAATVDPVSVDSSIVHPPGLPPAQALRPVEASAMGESRGGSPIGHYTSCGNRTQRISLRLVRSVDWLRRDCIRVRKQ